MTMKRRKKTPEEEAAYREFRRQSAENLRRLRELVARGTAELEARRAREGGAGS
jgi:hypothetical protein